MKNIKELIITNKTSKEIEEKLVSLIQRGFYDEYSERTLQEVYFLIDTLPDSFMKDSILQTVEKVESDLEDYMERYLM